MRPRHTHRSQGSLKPRLSVPAKKSSEPAAATTLINPSYPSFAEPPRLSELGDSEAARAMLVNLQRTAGNRAVQRLMGVGGSPAPGKARRIQRGWGDADAKAYPPAPGVGQLPTPTGGWNAGPQTIGSVERIPLEGIKEGLQAAGADKVTKSDPSTESEEGKAIAIVPTAPTPGAQVEILLHLHGHNVGYRERSKAGDGMLAGSVRDVVADRIEQQLTSSHRNMIAILPQGTTMSGFGTFNPDAYISEVWGRLVALKKLPPDAKRGAVVLSGHSGAASPITQLMLQDKLPKDLGEVILFDSIHGGQRPAVESFLGKRMAADVKAIKALADPTLNGGSDAATVAAQQVSYLAAGFRFRGIYTRKFNPQKEENGVKQWEDPETKKKPIYDTTQWVGYGVEYEPLAEFIKTWIDGHTKGLASNLVATLRENYKVIPAGAGAQHNTILGANDNLEKALAVLPVAPAVPTTTTSGTTPGTTPTPSKPADATNVGRTPAARKTSDLGEATVGPGAQGERSAAAGGSFVQRQPVPPPAPLTDAQQWEADWTSHPKQQGYFNDTGRPSGTPRERYDILCPLYKAQGIARPMVYLATSITTATFYTFSTPAHTDLATKLKAAETTLKGKGITAAPVSSAWALNARTTSKGGWSNHAEGRAIDLDPNANPFLIDANERKVISLVTGTDMEKSGAGYTAMKGASDTFKADYNAAGMQRRVNELTAAEALKTAARDADLAARDTLKAQAATLKTDLATLKTQLKSVPKGPKATADDVAKAAELNAAIKQNGLDSQKTRADQAVQLVELKKKEAELSSATKDRESLAKQLTAFQATDKAITDLETSIKALPDEITSLETQITQTTTDEGVANAANDSVAAAAQQKLRAKLTASLAASKAKLKKEQGQLTTKEKQRDDDPLRKYAAGGFLNLSKDVVDAMIGAGLNWGGNWKGPKEPTLASLTFALPRARGKRRLPPPGGREGFARESRDARIPAHARELGGKPELGILSSHGRSPLPRHRPGHHQFACPRR